MAVGIAAVGLAVGLAAGGASFVEGRRAQREARATASEGRKAQRAIEGERRQQEAARRMQTSIRLGRLRAGQEGAQAPSRSGTVLTSPTGAGSPPGIQPTSTKTLIGL
jgi:uncharacterized protein HemX